VISIDGQKCAAQARALLALTSRGLRLRCAQASGIPLSERCQFSDAAPSRLRRTPSWPPHILSPVELFLHRTLFMPEFNASAAEINLGFAPGHPCVAQNGAATLTLTTQSQTGPCLACGPAPYRTVHGNGRFCSGLGLPQAFAPCPHPAPGNLITRAPFLVWAWSAEA
jgi:hypothetical protein